jgi:predicted ester cyclase
VAGRRSYEGIHQGELLGIPPTGKQVRIGGISIIRLAGGKIAEQ